MNNKRVIQYVISVTALLFLKIMSVDSGFEEKAWAFGMQAGKNIAESLSATAQQIYTQATKKPKAPTPVHPRDRFFRDLYAGIRAPIPPGAINEVRTVKYTKASFNGTPLMAALRGRYVHVMEYLLKNGADPNIQNKDGVTALHLAARDGFTSALHILLDADADPNRADKAGMTPLMYAALKNKDGSHLACIKLLLAYGADVTKANNSGKTALSYAQSKHDEAVITLLKAASLRCSFDEETQEYTCSFGIPV